MEKVLKYIPFTTCVLLFLFICGGLYLIGYWSTFNVDITNTVDLMEVPKSFIFPFVVTFGIGFFFMVINFIAIDIFPKPKSRVLNMPAKDIGKKKLIIPVNKISFWILLSPLILLGIRSLIGNTQTFWYFSGFFLSMLLWVKGVLTEKIYFMFTNKNLAMPVIFLFVCTPVMSFCLGKGNGVKIYDNMEIKYINIININTANPTLPKTDHNLSSLKFLGLLGDKLILSSLDNKKIVFINQSSFEAVELVDFYLSK